MSLAVGYPKRTRRDALEGKVAEVGDVIHAHPTLSEVIKEASLLLGARAIHV